MSEKVAYLFAEKKPTFGICWLGIYYDKGIPVQSPESATRTLRELRKQDYTIIDTDVPLKNLVYGSHKYRDINEIDRKHIAHWEAELEHREKYPGLSRKELEILNELKDSKVINGLLWVSDVSFYPPGKLEYLTYQMGEAFAPITTYYLAADNRPKLAGRSGLNQYITVIRYFDKILSLRNTNEKEAKELSGLGRPLNNQELEQLIESKINIQPNSQK